MNTSGEVADLMVKEGLMITEEVTYKNFQVQILEYILIITI